MSGEHLRLAAIGIWCVLVVTLLAACAPQVATPPELAEGGPADYPHAYYRQLLAAGNPVFRVDPARSRVVIEVRRGGSFAKFGHDHVVASHDVTGNIAPDAGRADLYAPLDALIVDEPALRDEAGFDTQPDAADIAGTRRNMLEHVLDARQYPYALIGVDGVAASSHAGPVRLALTLHGVTRFVDTAAVWEWTGEEFFVTGSFAIDQSDFGMTPLALLGGAIAVQDRVNVSFRIRARRSRDAVR